jgi:peroxiredoxin
VRFLNKILLTLKESLVVIENKKIVEFFIATFWLINYIYIFPQPIARDNMRTTPYYFLEETIDFELTDAQHVSHKVSNYLGKKCIICFIKSDIISERCLLIHYLSNIYNWLKEQNIMLICVSTEPIANDFMEQDFITFPILLDRDRSISKKYCINYDDIFSTANTTFILDKNGVAIKILNAKSVGDLCSQIIIHAINHRNISEKHKYNTQTKYTSIKTEKYRSPAPDFELPNHEGKLIKLSDYRGKWCLIAFANKINNSSEYQRFLYLLNNIYKWLKQQDVEIICASTESVKELAQFKEHGYLQYCLLSDSKCLIPELFKEPWSFYNEFLSYLIDPMGNKITTFMSGSAQLHFAQLCRYFITQNPTARPI